MTGLMRVFKKNKIKLTIMIFFLSLHPHFPVESSLLTHVQTRRF